MWVGLWGYVDAVVVVDVGGVVLLGFGCWERLK